LVKNVAGTNGTTVPQSIIGVWPTLRLPHGLQLRPVQRGRAGNACSSVARATISGVFVADGRMHSFVHVRAWSATACAPLRDRRDAKRCRD